MHRYLYVRRAPSDMAAKPLVLIAHYDARPDGAGMRHLTQEVGGPWQNSSFFVLRVVNCLFVLEAIWSEFVIGRRLAVYEKGH